MIPSLRMRLVEAVEDAITNDGYWHLPPEQAEAALDAMLDCLAENADKWVGQAGWLPNDIATGNVRRDLLPVLRDHRSP